MTFEQVVELRKAEKLKTLRMPKCNENLTQDQKDELNEFVQAVAYLFTYLPEKLEAKYGDNLVKRTWLRKFLNKHKMKFQKNKFTKQTEKAIRDLGFVNSLEKMGDRQGYKISTTFGDGEFFLDREIFLNKQYPSFVKRNFCFANCLNFCQAENNRGMDIKILNGIFGAAEHPLCHSIITFRDAYVLDFNLGLVMTKELYIKICCFEVLSEITAEEIQDNIGLVREYSGVAKKYGAMPTAWCLYGFIEYLKKLYCGEIEEIDSQYML